MTTPLIVGLTGGIGSGKSSAADMFAELGAAVIDTDVIAHELTASGGGAMKQIRAAFGDDVISAEGTLDRPAMRHLVFRDAAAKTRLEAILHPMIHAVCQQRCDAAFAAGKPYVVLVVPLLIETTDYRRSVTRVAVVDCREETQIVRVAERSGFKRDEVLSIMATQVSREQRRFAADDIIDNDGDLDSLRKQVDLLHRKYMQFVIKSPLG